jgi:hypothetical protein
MVVIARYDECVDWVNHLDKPYIIYNKGESNIELPCIHVPNVGREGDTWLRYICSHYEDLDTMTYFVQGDPFAHCGFLKLPQLVYPFKGIGKMITDDAYGKPHHPEELPVGEVYEKIFGDKKDEFVFCAGAQYAVHKKAILSKPLNWWNDLYNLYNQTNNAAWAFERLWAYIWKLNLT